MPSLVNKWTKNIQDHLLPTACLLCGADGQGPLNLCQGCCASLPWTEQACARCAAALPESLRCPHCQQHPPSFAKTYAPFWYRPPVSDLILQLKFQGKLSTAATLGLLLSQRLRNRIDIYPDALLPVPLHRNRLRDRGYNQALEIARIVSEQLRIPLLLSGVERVRVTAPQSALKSHLERQRNVRGAFRLQRSFAKTAYLAIVDDVMTSGATVQALATALKQQGVARVDVWICARAT
jgi:ComF family protein